MEIKEFMEFIDTTLWEVQLLNKTLEEHIAKGFFDITYEISYADCVYDNATIWVKEKRVSLSHQEIEWGYTDHQSFDFTFEEFIECHNLTNES